MKIKTLALHSLPIICGVEIAMFLFGYQPHIPTPTLYYKTIYKTNYIDRWETNTVTEYRTDYKTVTNYHEEIRFPSFTISNLMVTNISYPIAYQTNELRYMYGGTGVIVSNMIDAGRDYTNTAVIYSPLFYGHTLQSWDLPGHYGYERRHR